MITEYGLGSLIVYSYRTCDCSKLQSGGCQLRPGSLMQMAFSACGNLPMACAKEGHGSYRTCSPSVVKAQLNWSGSKEVIQTNPIINGTATGLKQDVDMLYSCVGSNPKVTEHPLNGGLVDSIREEAVDLGRQFIGLEGHANKVPQLQIMALDSR
jgi:hypothetical protein